MILCYGNTTANPRIPESQHGRGWQGPLWVTQPNPLPKQGHPEQAAQHRGQAGLEYLQRRRLHSLPGQPVSLHSKERKSLTQGRYAMSLYALLYYIDFSYLIQIYIDLC